jgi:hypothetical protein
MRKVCSACEIEKDYSEFPKSQKGRKGVRAECIICSRIRASKRYYENREDCNAKAREWRLNNQEKVAVGMAEWRSEHKSEISEYNKYYAKTYPEKVKNAKKAWKINNTDKIAAQRKREKESPAYKIRMVRDSSKRGESVRQWRINNPEKYHQQMKRANDKRSEMAKYRVSGSISHGISRTITKGSKAEQHWESLVDFTLGQLQQHLEKLFRPGMTWENYGTAWQIDHKIPIAAFNFDKPSDIDFRLCWSLRNLQPLETTLNKIKSDKVEIPYQPSLAIAV